MPFSEDRPGELVQPEPIRTPVTRAANAAHVRKLKAAGFTSRAASHTARKYSNATDRERLHQVAANR
jgi:hypothetical protein